jgi:pimeloyl-ACP methyl ester carboxylesterase
MNIERLPYGKHPRQFFDWYTPHGVQSKVVIALIPGGFFRQKYYSKELGDPLAKDLVRLGYRVANIEYPRAGEMNCENIIKSVFTALDYLKLYSDEIIVIGHSAGGYLAIMAAMRPQFEGTFLEVTPGITPKKIIAQAPLTDLWRGHVEKLSTDGKGIQNFVDSCSQIPSDVSYYQALSPINYGTPECLIEIVHGTHDTDVPLRHSVDFLENQPTNVNLHRLECNHMDLIDPSSMAWLYQKQLLV